MTKRKPTIEEKLDTTTSHFTEWQQDNISITPDDVISKEKSFKTDFKQSWRVKTEFGIVHITEAVIKTEYSEISPFFDGISTEKAGLKGSRAVSTYRRQGKYKKISVDVGESIHLNFPPYDFGEFWGASLEGPQILGESLNQNLKMFTDIEYLDDFMTDIAKSITIGNWELTDHDIVANPRGEYAMLPYTNEQFTTDKHLQVISHMNTLFQKLNHIPTELFYIILLRAKDIGEYIIDNKKMINNEHRETVIEIVKKTRKFNIAPDIEHLSSNNNHNSKLTQKYDWDNVWKNPFKM